MKPGPFLFTRESRELSGIPGIFMFGTRIIKKTEPDRLQPHTNAGIEICYSWDGRFNWDVEGTMATLNPGGVSVTCPWQRHGGKGGSMNMGVLTWLIISPERFGPRTPLRLGDWSVFSAREETAIGNALRQDRTVAYDDAREVGMLLPYLMDELASARLGRTGKVNALVCDILLYTARKIMQPDDRQSRTREAVARVAALVRQNPAEPWTVRTMADGAGLGITAFTAAFKKHTGSAPSRFVTEQRIETATGMLRATDISVTDIAYQLGFSSSQHFANTYKKFTGHTPKEARHSI